MFRIICLAIGYVFGNLLTACIITRKNIGKTPFEVGSGNPGMANVMSVCGFKAGIEVLTGDILKTVGAYLLCRFVLFPEIDVALKTLWAGLGVVMGHNFPVWHRFKGGKGVATTCAVLVLSHPLYGCISLIVGMLVTLATGYLAVGAVVIPVVFIYPAYLLGSFEGMCIAVALSILMFCAHGKGLYGIVKHTEETVDIIGLIRKKWSRKSS